MANVIQSLLHNTLGDGARSTKFECYISLPAYKQIEENIGILVKTASFPSISHDVIDFKFKGRNIPIRGQAKYENTWACTFYLEDNHELKRAFNNEIESLDGVHTFSKTSQFIQALQSFNDRNYTSTLTILQVDFDDTRTTANYNLMNAFPKTITQVEVDYSDVGKILEYTVEFSYSHFEMFSMDEPTGSFVDQLKNSAMTYLEDSINVAKDQLTDYIADSMTGLSNLVTGKEQVDFDPNDMVE